MKKYKLTLVSLILCFVFSITLFSKETGKKDIPQIETISVENTKKDDITQKEQEAIKTDDIKKQVTDEINKDDIKKDISQIEPTKKETEKEEGSKKETTKKNNEKEKTLKVDEPADFSSIQVNGLSMAKGSRWYFEEYDENGNMIGSVSYDRRKLLSKSSIEYDDGKKVSATFTDPDMIVKVKYNSKGVEVARDEFTNEKGEIGKPLTSTSGVYDDQENLLEETKIENDVETRHVYTYNAKEKVTEAIYENGVQTLFIEYKQGTKTIHIFNEGVEVSVFDEEIE